MRVEDTRNAAVGGGGMVSERPLRIVHCFRAPIGGVFRHVADLVAAQSQAGHSVGLICDATTGSTLEEQRLEGLRPSLALGLKRIPMRRQIAPSDLSATWQLLREVRTLNPDILHAHGAKGGAYARIIGTLLRVSGLRVARIYSPHGGSLHYDAKGRSGRVYFVAERIFEKMTDTISFVSEYEAETYRLKVGRPRCRVALVHNGLRPEEFEPVVADDDAADFLFIGELRELKGTDVFIKAMAEIGRRRNRMPTGLIVGSGPDRARYEAMVRELGLADTVRFADPMPARQAFSLARNVVVPSRAESMPYIVLEAAGAGLPLVATRVGGIPEIFGAAANRLVPAGDAGALATAMIDQLDLPDVAKAEAENLQNRIRSDFSIEGMTGSIMAAYRAVTFTRD
jgi:glycosyltransferase involved in cell wall biosynthesis